jgi:hypothetical protein
MIEAIASSYFEFFPGDFILFGVLITVLWFRQRKEDEDFK